MAGLVPTTGQKIAALQFASRLEKAGVRKDSEVWKLSMQAWRCVQEIATRECAREVWGIEESVLALARLVVLARRKSE